MSHKKRTWAGLPKRFKRKVLMVVGAITAVATGAFAAILITAGMSGTLTTVAKPTLEWYAPAGQEPKQLSTDGSGIVCAPTISNGKLNVAINNAMPGASCSIEGKVRTTAPGLMLQDVDLTDVNLSLRNVGVAPLVCGSPLTANSAHVLTMDITVPNNAPIASNKPLTGQVTVVPSGQYDAALCLTP